MCYSDHARPPLPPISGGAPDTEDLHLTAADGNRFMAHAARAAQPSRRGMIILPDVRGLHGFYKELADRFGEAGFQAVAFDYFGRTVADGNRDEGFDWQTEIPKTTPKGIAADVEACIAYLRSEEGGGAESIFTVGFCFGGASSWRQSAQHDDGLAGCIGFYGGRPLERVGPWIPQMRAPILMLLAGVDSTPPEEFEQFAGRVRDAGVEVESHTYPGAPHSFFDRTWEEHKAASDDAWRRILDWAERHSVERVSG